MKLGFLGLGIMGYPMARNLLRAGHSVAVWSNTAAKARKLAVEENAELCAMPKAVAEAADIVFMCVGDTEMSERSHSAGRPHGRCSGRGHRRGLLYRRTFLCSPRRRSLRCQRRPFLDTPVTGSKPGAEGGTLTL